MIERLKQNPEFFASAFLVYLVCTAFYPILESDFLLIDVRDQVIENPHIQGLSPENLKHIFTSRSITSYYPVRSLTYAIDHQIWGLNATGYKLTNGLLHLTNVLLLFWLLMRFLRHPVSPQRVDEKWWNTVVATFAAGIFALHPLTAEPVAWVAGREELLMVLGILGCFHFHLSARTAWAEAKSRRAMACHFGAAFFCVLACLSNAVAAVTPALLTAWDLLTLERPKFGKIVRGTLALWLVGTITIVVKLLGPEATITRQVSMTPAGRLDVVLNVYWLNLKTFLWPADLAFRYPNLTPDGLLSSGVVLGAAAICLTCLAFRVFRRQKLVIFGLLWCAVAMAPSAQIMPHHLHRADRLLYLPLAGLAIALAAGIIPARNALRNHAAVAAVIAAGVLGLVALNARCVRQVRAWRDDVSVCENSVRVSPDDGPTRCALADSLTAYGQFDRAVQAYREAMRLDPDSAMPMVNFGWLLATCPDEQFRDFHQAIELAERGCELDPDDNPAFRHSLTTVYCAYAEELTDRREFGQIAEYYRKALAVDPDCQRALLQLAELLAFHDDPQLRDPEEAVRLAERACQLSEGVDPANLMLLAQIYAEMNRFQEAADTAARALRMAQDVNDSQSVSQLQRQIIQYESRMPPRPSQ